MDTTPSISTRTPAKINLGLEILFKRADGFHEINSVFLPIPLFDELTFSPIADEIVLHCDTLPEDASNLVVRAATALRSARGLDHKGAEITLRKNIPVGAGLGGGSSDAACALNMLNTMWEINASQQELHDIAKSIGADVPFFLNPHAAIVRGIGDIIMPIQFPMELHIVLVCPSTHVNTAWAYEQVVCDPERPATAYETIIPMLHDAADLVNFFSNDFEPFIFAHHPALQSIKDSLIESGAVFATMSGSGSAMVGVYQNSDLAALATLATQDSARFGEFAVWNLKFKM